MEEIQKKIQLLSCCLYTEKWKMPHSFVFLYNNKAKKSLNKYIKSLEGVFRYRDPKDYIQLIEPQQDSIIHIIPRKKKN